MKPIVVGGVCGDRIPLGDHLSLRNRDRYHDGLEHQKLRVVSFGAMA